MGGTGNDQLFAGGGDDLLSSGAGWDRVVLQAGFGQDRVTDFDVLRDRLVIDMGGQSWTTADVAGEAQLAFADGSILTLTGIPAASLTAWNLLVV